ncbi:hypothetical protein BHS09_34160 [Myxococcus xanthus]|uniref:HTTM-like domain-containing protein n=2 Tax=Myxococcus xanthus TaxID=34 RepID=A0AAE6KVT2_MYXXA|nr:hypothetical protein BHS09_34160 [Myxococcus xanthus]QDE78912.1 hypothetical protein BHS08_34185 [Myxococcus xanthus]QDF08244.1 hypothetical protein BHS04_34285 [Myxococcus xanthus]
MRVGASLFRVVSGSASLYFLMTCLPYRHYFFGPNGIYPKDQSAPAPALLSIFNYVTTPLALDALYLLTCAVALTWTLGTATRWLTPVHAVLMTSLFNRNPALADGGDNVFRIVIWFACFAMLEGARNKDGTEKSHEPSVAGLLHNAAILAMAAQIAIVYMSAGLTKVLGPSWRDGTALYYSLTAHEYRMGGISDFIRRNSGIVLLGTYTTVFFQVLFPALVVANKWTRRFAVACGLFFHLAIAGTMNLLTFAAQMLAVDLLLLTDGEYAWMKRVAQQWLARLRLMVAPTVAGPPASTAQAATPGASEGDPP